MTSEQILFYVIIGIVLLIYVRKQFLIRSLSNYSGEEAKQKVASGSILLDVRTSAERKSNSIPRSIHIPVQELSARMKELEKIPQQRDHLLLCKRKPKCQCRIEIKKSRIQSRKSKGWYWNMEFCETFRPLLITCKCGSPLMQLPVFLL